MQLRLPLFIKEALLFATALAVGLFIASEYGRYTAAKVVVEPLQFSWANIALLVGSFLFFSFVLSRYRRLSSVAFRLFLILVVVAGSQLFFAMFVPTPWDLALAALIAILMFTVRRVITHDIGVILGISGVAALLGLSVTPITALMVVMLLSIYDIVSVYKTKHMVALAEHMVASGAIFGFLIPLKTADFFSANLGDVRSTSMILGSGDIGLPIMFAASMVTSSLQSAVIVGAFSLAGLFVTHLLFVNQDGRHPMAALPPIATASILGYLISLYF